MRILVITNCLPYPLFSGDRIRLYNLLSRIAEKHEVWLVTFSDVKEETEGLQHLQEICHRVETVKLFHRQKLAYLPGLLKYGLAGKPVELVFYDSSELKRKIQKTISLVDFNIIQIEHTYMAPYIEAIPSNLWPKSILTFHNVEFVRLNRFFQMRQSPGKKIRTWLYWCMMRKWEPYYAEHFGRCIVMSEVDQHSLEVANPRLHTNIVSNGIDTHSFQPIPPPALKNSLLFVGSMDYGPCRDAMLFFCNEVLPLIRPKMGDVELWIVGKNPSSEIVKLDGNGIHVTGQVPDVTPYYNRCAICVVPLRAGGGTRLKILEAMALGRPVISTSIGCEGIEVVDGKHLLIGDNPEQFAQQTVRLLKDRELYDHIAANARELVVGRYDWNKIAEELMEVYRELENGVKRSIYKVSET